MANGVCSPSPTGGREVLEGPEKRQVRRAINRISRSKNGFAPQATKRARAVGGVLCRPTATRNTRIAGRSDPPSGAVRRPRFWPRGGGRSGPLFPSIVTDAIQFPRVLSARTRVEVARPSGAQSSAFPIERRQPCQ